MLEVIGPRVINYTRSLRVIDCGKNGLYGDLKKNILYFIGATSSLSTSRQILITCFETWRPSV